MASGRDTTADYSAVYDHGNIAGLADGRAHDPSARLVANLSAGFSAAGGFTGGKLGGGTSGGSAVEIGPGRCAPAAKQAGEERGARHDHGALATSITVAGLSCDIPADKSAAVNASSRSTTGLRSTAALVSGQNTLTRIEKTALVTRRTRHGVTLLLTVVALLAAAAGASAAAPTAITGPVTAVGATTATATGTVNPGGVATTWYVEYGTSTSYGSQTASASAGSGTANSAVSVVARRASRQGTTYHYRVVATSTPGTSRGSDGLFTTLAAPGAVTGSASSIAVSSATLNGTVDPNASATTWWFEYGTSTSYGSKTTVKSAGSGNGPDERLEPRSRGLQKGRTYHFRLRRDERRRHDARR